MTRNVGTFARGVLIFSGCALLALVFVGPQTWLGLVGLVPLVTGALEVESESTSAKRASGFLSAVLRGAFGGRT